MAKNKRKRGKSYGASRRVKKARTTGPVAFPASKKLPVFDRATYTKSICVYSDASRLVDPGLASCGTYVYSLNGMYDPDISGIGGQPTGFDQYMQLYEEYTVLKAKVTACVINSDTTLSQLAGINVCNSAATSSDPNVYLRNMCMGFRILDKYGDGSGVTTWTFEVDIDKLSTRNIWTDDAYSANSGNNPTQQWFLHIWNIAYDGSSNASPCVWTLKIEYLCAFRKPIQAANS